MRRQQHWTTSHTLGLFALLAAILFFSYYAPDDAQGWAFITVILFLVFFTAIAGHGITGIWRGSMIDERNKMSLSRFQLLAWTILVLSGLLVAVIGNLRLGAGDPVAITIPEELWFLLGISTTSLIGTPLVRSGKKVKKADPRDEARTFNQLSSQGIEARQLETEGLIIENQDPRQAKWSDLFRGEETANAAQLDLGKVQMFYFTVVLLIAYAVALGEDLASQSIVSTFPELSEGMVALLGISHAGYLTHKAVPHTKTT